MKPLAITLALLAAALVAEAASAESDSFQATGFHPFTMVIGPSSCPQSSHVYFGLNFHNCDPINLLFENTTVGAVTSLLQARGWSGFGLGSLQWVHLTIQAWPVLAERQLYLNMAGGSGPCPASVPLCRYHIRLWQLPNARGVIGAAHFEGGTFFVHDLLESWEFAEARVCADLASLPAVRCTPDALFLPAQAAVQGGPSWRASPGFSGLNNSRASLIAWGSD